jgi:hypothetical protein
MTVEETLQNDQRCEGLTMQQSSENHIYQNNQLFLMKSFLMKYLDEVITIIIFAAIVLVAIYFLEDVPPWPSWPY